LILTGTSETIILNTNLELTATCGVKLQLSCLSNPDLKLICFLLFLLTILPTCSASASVAA